MRRGTEWLQSRSLVFLNDCFVGIPANEASKILNFAVTKFYGSLMWITSYPHFFFANKWLIYSTPPRKTCQAICLTSLIFFIFFVLKVIHIVDKCAEGTLCWHFLYVPKPFTCCFVIYENIKFYKLVD